jgi:8-oxo-dGTP pyrophosphatase MutT (NUDIX family)
VDSIGQPGLRPNATPDARERDILGLQKRREKRQVVSAQYGALPYRFTEAAALEVLVVTTRRSRRWIIPKGWPIKGLTPSKSAAREAFEEAVVIGKIAAKSIGAFRYRKVENGGGVEAECEVKVFPLLVKRQSTIWPESDQRAVQWVDPENAISLIGEPELKAIVAAFAKRVAVPPFEKQKGG